MKLVGYKGKSILDVGMIYAPYIPMNMKEWSQITISEGYRGKWVIVVPLSRHEAVVSWCEQTFGEPGRGNKYRWRRAYLPIKNSSSYRIFLRSESDVLLFRLRWM